MTLPYVEYAELGCLEQAVPAILVALGGLRSRSRRQGMSSQNQEIAVKHRIQLGSYLLFLLLIVMAALGGVLVTRATRRPGPVTTTPFELPLLLDMTHPIFDDSPPGYVRVLPSDIYTPERGFGWSHNVLVFDANTDPYDRLNLDSLHRDSHFGLNSPGRPGYIFRIDVPPGSYLLTVVTGAAVHGPHALGLVINGKELLPLRRTPPDGKPRVHEFTLSPHEGRIEIRPVTEVGTEWLISAIELRQAPEP